MHPANRKLLLVAFHYPPDNTSTGVLRTLKFTQYLPEYGWDCDVVSAPERLYFSVDADSTGRIPASTRVFRPWGADTKKLFGFRGVSPSFFGVPDRYWPWIVPAVRKCGDLIRGDAGIDAVYTTYPVPSALLIGLILKRRHRLPWIADFRDPWVEDSMPRMRRAVEGHMERRVLAGADRVICNTPRMRDWFLDRYPTLAPEKFVTIPNGYDEAELQGIAPLPVPKFEVTYTGIITSGNRNPRPLLAAVRVAIDNGWIPEDDVQVTFLGAGPYARSGEFLGEVDRYRLAGVVEVSEHRIPYHEALRRAAGADVILVLSEPPGTDSRAAAERAWSHLQVPVKVYEGLGLRRRLLALVSDGAVADLLQQTQSGTTVPPSDIEGIARALRSYYEDSKRDGAGWSVNTNELAKYARRRLAGMLAGELDAIAPPGAKVR